MSTYPTIRTRRLRQNAEIRALVRETHVSMADLIVPLFIVPGKGIKQPIASLVNHHRLSPDMAAEEALALKAMGVQGVLLFGLPEYKDETGSSAYQDNGVVQQAIRMIKKEVPNLLVMADLCFCEYTSHGHCGVIENNDVHNDHTLVEIQKQTLSLANAGVDVIAPSGMMDGTAHTIRTALDQADFHNTVIMSYSVKYASSYYGPFRSAVNSAPSFGDRKTYQMDPANAREALRRAQIDIKEGADIIMVKPALVYLDIIAKVKEETTVPMAAYNVSGEYAMIKLAAKEGLMDESAVIYETLLSIKRAGADIIITYFAKDLYRILKA